MRLLWEESTLGVIGAFCVVAFALGGAWIVLEGLADLNGVLAGLLAAAAAGGTLEAISRRHYADRDTFTASRSTRQPLSTRPPATRPPPSSARKSREASRPASRRAA